MKTIRDLCEKQNAVARAQVTRSFQQTRVAKAQRALEDALKGLAEAEANLATAQFALESFACDAP
jgi:ABC-type branched-subunit amino acid transport system ATPase component